MCDFLFILVWTMIGISIANTMTWMISWYVHLFIFVLTISSRIIHCNYNDKDDIMIIIPLHLCTDTPCHLPTWTAPPCNWPKDQKIKFSLQLSQKGFCSLFQKILFLLQLSNTRSLKDPNRCQSDILANLQNLVKNTFS